MKPLRIVIVGTLASDPYAGMAWMHMQIAVGLRRLGHDVYYFETTSTWPYDPMRRTRVNDSDYALPYLKSVCESFGMSDRWAYRRSYSDKQWFGLERAAAEQLLAHADAVINVSGSTRLADGPKPGRLVYLGTDPVTHEVRHSQGHADTKWILEEHTDCITYGENIGNADCPVPALPGLKGKMRQPVLLDLWESGPPKYDAFTTVGNWKQNGSDIEFRGETYYWSKHHEFLKFIDLPKRVPEAIELAMGPDEDVKRMLQGHGWRVANAHEFSTDPWKYRDYVRASRGEFTVAKDQNVRLRSGWFSERSACYLAAGRPVITQDTGFGNILPTGEGLFAFNTMEQALAAFEAIRSDYTRHSRAARAIAEEYFRAETVLKRMLTDLQLQ